MSLEAYRARMIIHVALISWREWTTAEQIAEAKATFLALTSKIPGITGAYWGETMPGVSNGFKNGVVVLADSPATLEAYHAHPDHHKLTAIIGARASRMSGADLRA